MITQIFGFIPRIVPVRPPLAERIVVRREAETDSLRADFQKLNKLTSSFPPDRG